MRVAPRQADSFHHQFPVAVVGKLFMPEKLSATVANKIRNKVLLFAQSSSTEASPAHINGSSPRSRLVANLRSEEVDRHYELSVMTLAQEKTWGMSEYSIEGGMLRVSWTKLSYFPIV